MPRPCVFATGAGRPGSVRRGMGVCAVVAIAAVLSCEPTNEPLLEDRHHILGRRMMAQEVGPLDLRYVSLASALAEINKRLERPITMHVCTHLAGVTVHLGASGGLTVDDALLILWAQTGGQFSPRGGRHGDLPVARFRCGASDDDSVRNDVSEGGVGGG